MASIMEKEKTLLELVKTFQNSVKVATFTTLLHRTLREINTTVMGVFFARYTNKTAKDY